MANYGSYVKKTASCPLFGDWAIANKLTIKWGNAKRGDIVLFDFNHNGTSDHIGIVTKVTADYIETIEGNTGYQKVNGQKVPSNTNGDGVYRRKRYKSQVNYFVRTKCPNIEAVIKTAESQLGYKEGRNNNNKYGKWFGYNNVAWCCEFVVWCFYHTTATSTTPAKTETKKVSYKHCIDTSYWQGKHSVSDWKKVRKSCTYAIHRASYTSLKKFALYTDSTFQTNFKNSKAAGFKCGAYHYSQALTVEEAKKEAEFLCKQLKGLDVDFYVVCDYEYGDRLNSKTSGKANDVVNAFCDVVKSHGYSPCIYANTSTLSKRVTKPKYPVWVAQYSSTCDYKKSKVMWQYTSKGKVSGISGNVDLSLVYSAPKIEPKPTPTPEPTKKAYSGAMPDFVELSGEIISQTANKLAWPLGTATSKYKYPKGKATAKFTEAINKVFPKRSSWSKQCQAGASCDVGVATVLRYCGAFPTVSRGLSEQFKEFKASSKWKDVGLKKTSDFKPGDVGLYKKKIKGAHIWTTIGGTKVVESNHTAKYCLHRVNKDITNKGCKEFHCYRMIKPIRSYLKYGDEGNQVARWQKFLKWYGFDCSADGDFGAKTLGFTKTFQYENGLTSDGEVGAKTLQKAKAVKK